MVAVSEDNIPTATCSKFTHQKLKVVLLGEGVSVEEPMASLSSHIEKEKQSTLDGGSATPDRN